MMVPCWYCKPQFPRKVFVGGRFVLERKPTGQVQHPQQAEWKTYDCPLCDGTTLLKATPAVEKALRAAIRRGVERDAELTAEVLSAEVIA